MIGYLVIGGAILYILFLVYYGYIKYKIAQFNNKIHEGESKDVK